jgi:hypothetical protein
MKLKTLFRQPAIYVTVPTLLVVLYLPGIIILGSLFSNINNTYLYPLPASDYSAFVGRQALIYNGTLPDGQRFYLYEVAASGLVKKKLVPTNFFPGCAWNDDVELNKCVDAARGALVRVPEVQFWTGLDDAICSTQLKDGSTVSFCGERNTQIGACGGGELNPFPCFVYSRDKIIHKSGEHRDVVFTLHSAGTFAGYHNPRGVKGILFSEDEAAVLLAVERSDRTPASEETQMFKHRQALGRQDIGDGVPNRIYDVVVQYLLDLRTGKTAYLTDQLPIEDVVYIR